jgi:hypothetical protein
MILAKTRVSLNPYSFVARSDTGKKLGCLSIYNLWQGLILEKDRAFVYLAFVARPNPDQKA